MPFNVVPKAAPSAPASGQSPDASSKAQAARAKAIAMLSGTQAPDPQTAPPVEAAKAAPEAPEASAQEAASSGQISKDESAVSSAAEPAAPAKPADEPLSSQYAQLARKEKAIRAQAQQAKEREAALAAREAALAAKEQELQGDKYIPKERLTKETLKTLSEAGLSYEQITQLMLNAPSPEAQAQEAVISELKTQIAELKAGQDKVKETFESSQKQAYDQAISQIRTDAKKLVFTDPNFETIKETNSVNDVVDLIVQTFEKGLDEARPKGTLLTVEEAAQLVEEHLAEEAFKLANLSKIQKRLAEKAAAAAPKKDAGKPADPTPEPGVKQITMKTLTNRDGSARKLTASERAILAFKGELHKS